MSGIGFPVQRDVLMTGNGLNRIMLGNSGQQGLQAGVLCFGKRLEIAAFQFDTDGKSIAFFSALKRRYSGMIGHVVAGNELDSFALTADEKMAGNAQGVDDAEKRMLIRVDLVGKQFFYCPRVVLKRREGNIVEHNQRDVFIRFARAEIGRMSLACIQPTAVLPSVF